MHGHMSVNVCKSLYQVVKYQKFNFSVLVFNSTKRMFWFLHILLCRFIEYFYILLSGILICRPTVNCFILSSLFKKIGFAYLEFMFLGVLILFFFSRVSFVDVCVIFLVNCRNSLVPKCSVLF